MNIKRLAIASVLIINILATSCLPIESEFILGDNVTVGNNLFVTNRAYGGHDPIADNEYTTKNYVDSVAGGGGGAGNVTTAGGIAARIPYYTAATNIEETTVVYNAASGNVTMQNNLTVNGRAYGGHDPIADNEYTTKNYVDSVAGGGGVTVSSVPTDNATTVAISSDWAFDSHATMKDPTGFTNRTDSTWVFVGGLVRTLTVSTVSGYHLWFNGIRHTIAASENITIADTEGQHLIYFDTDNNLHEYVNPTEGELYLAITEKCLVAFIYWDATNDVGVYVGEERHGTVMDGVTHYSLHSTRGLQYVSGLTLGNFSIGTGAADADAQFSIATGSTVDEDLGITITAIASNVGLPILYRDGASGYWRTVTDAGFSVYNNPAGVTNRLMWNQWTGATWQLTEAGENDYVLCHVYMTTGKVNQMYAIMGQAKYTTVKLAREGAVTEIGNLQVGNLPSPEIRPAATVIFETDKDYANAINARVVEVIAGGDDYVSWLTNDLPRGTTPIDVTDLIKGSGTVNTIPVFSTVSTLGNSIITQNAGATQATITGGLSVTENITMVAGKLVDGVDVSAHETRHMWNAADELNLKDLEMGSYIFFLAGHGAGGQFTETLTAGRGVTDVSYTSMSATSGAVTNDVAGRVCGTNVYFDKDTANDRVRLSFRFQPSTTCNKAEFWIGYFNDATTFPITTSRHCGIRIVETAGAGDYHGVVYASNGTGAAGTQTSIDTTCGTWDTYDFYIKYMASDIKFYMSKNGAALTLVATHTTNMLDDHGQFFGIWSKTTEIVAKTAYVYVPRTLKGAD